MRLHGVLLCTTKFHSRRNFPIVKGELIHVFLKQHFTFILTILIFGQNAFFLQNTSLKYVSHFSNCILPNSTERYSFHDSSHNHLVIQKESIYFDHVWNFTNTYKTIISIKKEQLFYDTFHIESQCFTAESRKIKYIFLIISCSMVYC